VKQGSSLRASEIVINGRMYFLFIPWSMFQVFFIWNRRLLAPCSTHSLVYLDPSIKSIVNDPFMAYAWADVSMRDGLYYENSAIWSGPFLVRNFGSELAKVGGYSRLLVSDGGCLF
jgi:hypothetical protein